MDIFLITFKQVVGLFLIIFVGLVCCKAGVLTDKSKKELSGLLVNIVIPAVIINSFQRQMDLSKAEVLFESFFYCIIVHICLIILAALFLPKRLGPNYSIERISVIYTNAGFMGLPLLSALFGEEGTLYAAVYVSVFHLFMWTAGTFSLTKDKSLKSAVRQLCSPTIIAVLIALLFLFLNVKLPEVLLTPLGYVADMNTPLAMIVTGVSLASIDLCELFGTRKLYYVTALRLLILPLILVGLFRLLQFSGMASDCALVSAACPTAAIAPMVAVQYGHDEKTASGIFALTTLLSLFTIPLFMLFL
ncbi:MAG: AEC family transporter [Eubacteriales bacterium]|nr:AEC family transporter [Eubacteriales bacterium]